MELVYLKKHDPAKSSSLEKSIYSRSSTRSFEDKPLKLDTLSRIIWAGNGITEEKGRTIPSAGAIYPLELFIISRNVNGLASGIYHYLPQEHALEPAEAGDFMEKLSSACFHQQFIETASFSIIVAGDFEKTKKRYGTRGERYVFMEAGHCCQNMSLIAENSGIGTVVVGAFSDRELSDLLNLGDWFPIAVMPFGHKKEDIDF